MFSVAPVAPRLWWHDIYYSYRRKGRKLGRPGHLQSFVGLLVTSDLGRLQYIIATVVRIEGWGDLVACRILLAC